MQNDYDKINELEKALDRFIITLGQELGLTKFLNWLNDKLNGIAK